MNIRDRYTRVSQLSRIIQWIIRGSLILVPSSLGVIFALDYFEIPGLTTNVWFTSTWTMENQYGDPVTKVRLIDVLIKGPLALLVVYTAIAPVYHFDRLLTLYRRRTILPQRSNTICAEWGSCFSRCKFSMCWSSHYRDIRPTWFATAAATVLSFHSNPVM